MQKAAIIIPVLMSVLTGCSPKPAEAPPAKPAAPVGFGYDIALHVDQNAADVTHTLTVSAMYYGLPTPATASQATDAGAILFNTDKVTVEARDQTVHMTGEGVPPERLKDIVAGAPLVQITVSDKGKHVQCSVFQDYVKTAQAKPVAIYCGRPIYD